MQIQNIFEAFDSEYWMFPLVINQHDF